MHARADVEVAHQLSIGLEQGGLLLLQSANSVSHEKYSSYGRDPKGRAETSHIFV